MPYLSVLSDFRADVRKIAREQKGEEMTSGVFSREVGKFLQSVTSFSDGAAAAVRRRPRRHAT